MQGDRPRAEPAGRRNEALGEAVNVLALSRAGEDFIFLYVDDQRDELLRTFGRYASDPELSFSWYEAAVLSKKVRSIH